MDKDKVLSVNTIKAYKLSYSQFEKYLTEKKVKSVNKKVLEDYAKASAEGFPNGKPKKPSSIGIKYKGIIHCLQERGDKFEFERDFVNRVLGISESAETSEETLPVPVKSKLA